MKFSHRCLTFAVKSCCREGASNELSRSAAVDVLRDVFFANVPTLNNFTPYFTPNYPHLGTSPNDWNTSGDCSFHIQKCTVRSVTDLNGVVSTVSFNDVPVFVPLCGARPQRITNSIALKP